MGRYRTAEDLVDKVKNIIDRLLILEKRGSLSPVPVAVTFFDPTSVISTTSGTLSTVGLIIWNQQKTHLTVTIYMQNDSGTQPEFALTNPSASVVYGSVIPADPASSYTSITIDNSLAPAGPIAVAFKRNVGAGTCRAAIASVTEASP